MSDKQKTLLENIDTEKFLEEFLSIVEEQKVCSDSDDKCDIRITSFGECCVKCGLLPNFWEGSYE